MKQDFIDWEKNLTHLFALGFEEYPNRYGNMLKPDARNTFEDSDAKISVRVASKN